MFRCNINHVTSIHFSKTIRVTSYQKVAESYFSKIKDDIITKIAEQRIIDEKFPIPYQELRSRPEYENVTNHQISVAITNRKYYLQKKMRRAPFNENISLNFFDN